MSAPDASAVLAALSARPPKAAPARAPLPCRALAAPSGVSPAGLGRDLAALSLPERTAALLTGNAAGLGVVDAAGVRWVHARTRSLVATVLGKEVRVAAYRADVSGLTGLGPGLTPTGDDLLVGLAAMGRHLAASGLVEPRAVLALSTSFAGLPARETTPVARDLLAKAAKGHFPSVLAAVVERFGSARSDAGSLRTLVEKLAATGAHSGADLLAGALALARGTVASPEAG